MERDQETLKGKQKNFNPVAKGEQCKSFHLKNRKKNSARFVLQYLQNAHFLGSWDISKLWKPLSSLIVGDFCPSAV